MWREGTLSGGWAERREGKEWSERERERGRVRQVQHPSQLTLTLLVLTAKGDEGVRGVREGEEAKGSALPIHPGAPGVCYSRSRHSGRQAARVALGYAL